MEIEVRSTITLRNMHWHADGILYTHALSPLIQKKASVFSPLHRQPEYAISMIFDFVRSRSRRRDHPADIGASPEPIQNPPPPPSKYICIYK